MSAIGHGRIGGRRTCRVGRLLFLANLFGIYVICRVDLIQKFVINVVIVNG